MGEPSRSENPRPRWHGWITNSPESFVIDVWLSRVTAVALVVAVGMVVFTVFVRRPIHGASVLLVAALPVVAFGQCWMIGVLNARNPKPPGGWRAQVAQQRRLQANPRKFFFAGLPKAIGSALVVVFFLCWLAAVTAFADLSKGSPTSSTATCRWPVSNHAVVTCVSREAYERAGAAEQRLAAGVLAGFFSAHFGAATSEIVRRRRPDK